MESLTTSKRHFIKYDVKPVALATDPNPNYYIHTKEKFDCKTTNEETYYPKVAEKVTTYKPEGNLADRSGLIDFNSNYRNEFVNHGLTMCEAKAYFLAEALKKQQLPRQNTSTDKTESLRLSTTSSIRKKAPRVPSSTQFSNKLATQVA